MIGLELMTGLEVMTGVLVRQTLLLLLNEVLEGYLVQCHSALLQTEPGLLLDALPGGHVQAAAIQTVLETALTLTILGQLVVALELHVRGLLLTAPIGN